ncbi:oxidoreductase [Synergistales bacterium]|nr:oxidoreductase [Synergistales bacterium]
MKMIKTDSLGVTTSLIGFGAMRLPQTSDNAADIDAEKTQAMVDAAIAGGVNYFDTAYVYHGGKSEEILRTTLTSKYKREDYYLADKLSVFASKSADEMKAMFGVQLERCGADYFDFYLLHSVGRERYEQQKAFGAFDYMKKLKDSGKVRHIGFSFHDKADMLEFTLDNHPEFEFVQLQLNYLDWDRMGAKDIYRVARERGLPIIVMEPVKGGALAKLPDAAAKLSGGLADRGGQAAFALRFTASLEGVMTVLSGMSSIEQVTGNINTFSDFKKFTDGDTKLVSRVLEELRKISLIQCTSCGYCLDGCPAKIDIPKLFAIYNDWKNGGALFPAQIAYAGFDVKADSCVSCGACAKVCPQSIDIPAELAKLHEAIPNFDLIPPEVKENLAAKRA